MKRRISLLLLSSLFAWTLACTPEPDPDPPQPPAPKIPSLVAISPAVGLTSGGETITLSGSNLSEVSTVAFGTAAAEIQSSDSSTLIVTAPAGDRGVATIKATAADGTAELLDAYTYQQAVEVLAINPAAIPAGAAAEIDVTGSGFVVDETDPVIRVAGAVVNVLSATDTSATVEVPALDVGAYDVSVENADGRQATLSSALNVRDPVLITGVDPNWSFIGDTDEVTIIGSAFDGVTAVLFGETPALAFSVVNSTTITATVPVVAVAGAVDLVVRRSVGDEGVMRQGFNYYDPGDTTLRVLSLSPAVGRAAGGTQVILTGTGFNSSTTITFAGQNAAIDQVAGTSLQVTTPAYSFAGTLVSEPVDVVAHRQADVATLSNGFTYYRVPVITQVNPTVLASAGGDSVTVNGEGFTIGSTQVFFGNVAATNVNVITQSELSCDAPPHAEGENIPVTVQSEFETSTEWVGVAFREFTRIQAVTPSVISISGRTFITVIGTGFAEAVHMTVTIDGNPVDDLARDQVNLHRLTFRSRGPMNPGTKALLVRNNETGQEDTEDIQVVDPTDKDALHGGGPVDRNVNVTVIRDDTLARVPGAIVFAGNDGAVTEASYNKGVTDQDGMTVLSGDKVVSGPITLTVGATDFETQSLIGLDAQNITLLITPKSPTDMPQDHGVISGVVTGWANAGLPSGSPDTRYYRVAQVYPSDADPLNGNYQPGIESYAIEIRNGQSACSLVLPDGTPTTLSDAAYSVNSQPGVHATLAVVYYWDSVNGTCNDNPIAGTQACIDANNQNCEGWVGGMIGATYGVTTGINVEGGGGATNGNNINLDVAAVNYTANINGNPTYLGSDGTAYTADAYLNLGNSGSFTFLGELKGDGAGINFGSVPLLRDTWTYTVRGYVAAPVIEGTAITGFNTPIATSFARGLTSMSPPTLSTWVFFPSFGNDAFENGTTLSPTEGRFHYLRSGGATPDATIIFVYDSGENVTPLWTIIAKGDPGTITLPELTSETRIDNIPADADHYWSLYQFKVDDFNFDEHTATDRTTLRWRAGTESQAQVFHKLD